MGAADSVLLVGAYCSKTNFTDINGNSWTYSGYVQANRLVPFSSRGPMIDGRIKPDITAPGMTLCTSISSYDTAYTPTGSNSALVIKSWFDAALNKTFYFAEFSGTSASAPCAAGIIALMMQAYPDLSAQQAKDIIAATAIVDFYTGAIPPQGNNNWGHGKINAYQAIKLLLIQTGIYAYEGTSPDCILYPNPNDGNSALHLNAVSAGQVQVEIFDMKGSMLLSDQWKVLPGENSYDLHLMQHGKGIYLVKASTDKGSVTIKTVVK
jgi:subtilisin family serine protease